MLNIILVLLLLAPLQDEREDLDLKEAEAIVCLYEARLHTSQVQVKQFKVHRDHDLDRAKKLHDLHQNDAVAVREYLDAKRDYESAEIAVELGECEVEECRMELNLAKVRRELSAHGLKVRALKTDKMNPVVR